MDADFEKKLSAAVNLYSEKYRNPNLSPFVVCKPHSMTSWYGTPEAAKPGCYVFFSDDGQPHYVGKAPLTRHVGHRVAAHDHKQPRAEWRERAAFLVFVSVPEPFEAPSLEEFLIGHLHPVGNLRGSQLVTTDLASEVASK